MFFYDAFFNQAVTALAGTAISSIQNVAYMILAITFFMSVYEAFARGGDTRQLMIGFLKYVICAVAIQNWPSIFTDIHTATETIAGNITTRDYVTLWQGSYSQFLQQNPAPIISGIAATLANLVTSATITILGLVFTLALSLYDFLYAIWGCILFCIAPLLIATMPSMSLGSFGKKFLTGFAEWTMWPVLYAVFGAMAFGMNGANVSTILASKSYQDIIAGTSNMILISITSLIVGLCLLIIPFIAHFLIGASFDGVAGAAFAMTKMASNMTTGGATAATGGGSGGSSGGGSGGGGGGATGNGSAGASNSEAYSRQSTNTNSTPPPSTPTVNNEGRSNLVIMKSA